MVDGVQKGVQSPALNTLSVRICFHAESKARKISVAAPDSDDIIIT